MSNEWWPTFRHVLIDFNYFGEVNIVRKRVMQSVVVVNSIFDSHFPLCGHVGL